MSMSQGALWWFLEFGSIGEELLNFDVCCHWKFSKRVKEHIYFVKLPCIMCSKTCATLVKHEMKAFEHEVLTLSTNVFSMSFFL
jgi:hypothetical protein